MFGFNKTASKETLEQEAKNLSVNGNVQAIKDWWNNKSKKERAIIIGILVAACAAPAWIIYAKGMTVTTFVPEATGGLWQITTASPLWAKALSAGTGIIMTGVISAEIHARFNGISIHDAMEKAKV